MRCPPLSMPPPQRKSRMASSFLQYDVSTTRVQVAGGRAVKWVSLLHVGPNGRSPKRSEGCGRVGVLLAALLPENGSRAASLAALRAAAARSPLLVKQLPKPPHRLPRRLLRVWIRERLRREIAVVANLAKRRDHRTEVRVPEARRAAVGVGEMDVADVLAAGRIAAAMFASSMFMWNRSASSLTPLVEQPLQEPDAVLDRVDQVRLVAVERLVEQAPARGSPRGSPSSVRASAR